MEAFELAIPFVTALVAAALLTPLVGRLALAIGAVDRPNLRKVSQRPAMPLLGGLAVAAAFALGLVVVGAVRPGVLEPGKLQGLAIAGAVMLALGIVDDRFGLGARAKLAGQLLAALIAIAHGFEIFGFTNPLTDDMVHLPRWLVWVATSFWIVAVTNAVNLLDGLDGLAAGVCAIIVATLAYIAWDAVHPLPMCLGIVLLGALLGFLPHNFSPARIFLGDTGSLFVGFVLSLVAMECYRRVSLITLMVPLLTLAVPLLDTALSIVRRVRLRAPIFSADRLHMHHRLLESEGSARGAVLQFYLLTAAFCLIAVSFARIEGWAAGWPAGFLAAVVVLTVRLLWNMGVLSKDVGSGSEAPGELPTHAEEGKR